MEFEVDFLTENSLTDHLQYDSAHRLFTKDFSSWSETPMFVLPINWSNLFSFEVYICLHIFFLLLLQMLLVKWHNWKMPSKNIKSKRPNAKCTLLAKPPKLTVMKPTDLWPNKSMTFSGKKKFFFILSHDLLLSLYFFWSVNKI